MKQHLLVLALTLAGCSGQPSPAGPATASAPLVVTHQVKMRPGLGGERFSATVEADTRVRLTFNSPGYVQSIAQREGQSGRHLLGAGDRVRSGEVLAELRTAEYRARVQEAESNLGQALAGEQDSLAGVDLARAQTRQARAQVEQARASELQSRAQVRELEAVLQAARAQEGEARAQLQKSQADWERAQQLMAADSLTRPDFDTARASYEVARGKLREAEEQVRQRAAQLLKARTEVRAAGARVEQALGQVDASLAQEGRAQAGVLSSRSRIHGARSNVEQANVQLGDVYLKAPMDGIILNRAVEVGAQVAPGTVGFELADTHHVLVTFGVPDILVKQLKLGQTLALQCEALPGTRFQGQVRTISPEADPQSRVYKVEVRVPNQKDELKVGMIANLDLGGPQPNRAVLTVPLGALQPSKKTPGGYQVFCVEGERARAVEVKVGKPQGDQMEVTEGLKAGDSVIVEGAHLVVDGQNVKVKS